MQIVVIKPPKVIRGILKTHVWSKDHPRRGVNIKP